MVAFHQEQKKVTDLQEEMSSQMKIMEIENSKLLSANKVSLHVIHFGIGAYIVTEFFCPALDPFVNEQILQHSL